MGLFAVTIDSPFEGGASHLDTVIETPVGPQFAYELGTDRPTAQELADYYAGEYCDSGTVLVVNTADRADRAHVARRTAPA